jgi:hypothetical protein
LPPTATPTKMLLIMSCCRFLLHTKWTWHSKLAPINTPIYSGEFRIWFANQRNSISEWMYPIADKLFHISIHWVSQRRPEYEYVYNLQ